MTSGVIDRVRRVITLRDSFAVPGSRDPVTIRSGLKDVAAVRSWASAMEAALTVELSSASSFPEEAIAAAARTSVGAASKTRERAETLASVPSFAEALEEGSIATGHADELARAAGKLDGVEQRSNLFDRAERLLSQAEDSTIDSFRRTLNREVNDIQKCDGMAKLERQRRATRMSSWTDDDGMWNLRAKFDPLSAVTLNRRIDKMVETLYAERTPDSCPADPVEKQKHLKALALARLIADDTRHAHALGVDSREGGRADAARSGAADDAPTEASVGPSVGVADAVAVDSARAGSVAGVSASGEGRWVIEGPAAGARSCVGRTTGRRLEVLAVIDADQPNGGGGPEVDWGIAVEIPPSVLAELAEVGDVDVVPVVVRNGVVLHAPGELNMGRGARHANRAQRRALRGMYAGCAIPGCAVHFDRCKIHHIIWWSHGGLTDLDNLLPVCVHHHHKIHDAGWHVELGRNRQLTVTFPDGNVLATGPPGRRTAEPALRRTPGPKPQSSSKSTPIE